MNFADPLAQVEIDRLRAENRTLRRGSRTLGEIITATNRDLAELVGWEIDEDQDSVEWAAAWDQLREMRDEMVGLRAKIARVEALAESMDTWCSPYGLALHYADSIRAALRDPEESA